MLGLMGFNYESTFWTQVAVQFSVSSPAVLHAILALSALHEHLESSSATTAEGNQLVLKEYDKSIEHLCSFQSTQPIQVTRTCCILLISLENTQENHDTALARL
ncbi:hypothetical protein K432DRAFT_214942 [Lepidopterella palustris CBS 459.81]|uniref:Uncharacterized protein n=1 Tax=Lepidopterella palustris CBS 459.81 TaxID=1314670 RepID=A0A8E2EEP2_9PEZI|nr:hypothetical protein K432DRAFT_214942 [Lepidopterella palustris CBS 459.81]